MSLNPCVPSALSSSQRLSISHLKCSSLMFPRVLINHPNTSASTSLSVPSQSCWTAISLLLSLVQSADISSNKYQTKDTIQLIPTDPGKAALFEQFISVESSEFFDSVIKYIADVFKKNKGSTSDPEQTALFRKNSEITLDVYNNILEGKNYLVGDSFILADLVHLAYSRFALQAGLDDVFNSPSHPNVTRWFNNITSETSWKAALGDL